MLYTTESQVKSKVGMVPGMGKISEQSLKTGTIKKAFSSFA